MRVRSKTVLTRKASCSSKNSKLRCTLSTSIVKHHELGKITQRNGFVCAVCSIRKASGFHYNVLACESKWKVFIIGLRRSKTYCYLTTFFWNYWLLCKFHWLLELISNPVLFSVRNLKMYVKVILIVTYRGI